MQRKSTEKKGFYFFKVLGSFYNSKSNMDSVLFVSDEQIIQSYDYGIELGKLGLKRNLILFREDFIALSEVEKIALIDGWQSGFQDYILRTQYN